jgi:hypothetical protein
LLELVHAWVILISICVHKFAFPSIHLTVMLSIHHLTGLFAPCHSVIAHNQGMLLIRT